MKVWKGFQVPKRVRLVIYGVFVNFSWGHFASQLGRVSGGLYFTTQNASWLLETGVPCESGATRGGAGGRSRGKPLYFQRFSPIRVVFMLLWRVPFRGCENIRKYT